MTPAMVRTLVGGTADWTDAEIQPALDVALQAQNPEAWGACYPRAVALYAGHILQRSGATKGGEEQGAGAVTGRSTGGRSESYGSLSGADAVLGTTQAGVDFIALRRSCIMAARTI